MVYSYKFMVVGWATYGYRHGTSIVWYDKRMVICMVIGMFIGMVCGLFI